MSFAPFPLRYGVLNVLSVSGLLAVGLGMQTCSGVFTTNPPAEDTGSVEVVDTGWHDEYMWDPAYLCPSDSYRRLDEHIGGVHVRGIEEPQSQQELLGCVDDCFRDFAFRACVEDCLLEIPPTSPPF